MKVALVALLAMAMLAGCASGSTGTLTVQATDAPGAIGDFSSLVVQVTKISVSGSAGAHDYTPSQSSFDLVKLTEGNVTTLFHDKVATGNYSKLTLEVAKATGTLKAGGSVDIKVPASSIFLTQQFSVGSGKETTFLFDLHVVAKGNGDYSLQPNAGGSHATSR